MIADTIKSFLGWSPVIATTLAQAASTFDFSAIEKGSGYVAAALLWYFLGKKEAAYKEKEASCRDAWDKVEQYRSERDEWRQKYIDVQKQCANCSGNAERIKQKKDQLDEKV